MFPSTTAPSASRAQRLTRWLLAVVLAGALGAASLAAPASAGPIDEIYQPRCYNTLCLTVTSEALHDGYLLDAWSLFDVGPTPYYISIFETETGLLREVCGSGTSCITYIGSGACTHFVAYIGGYPASMPPSPVLRTSPVVRHPGYPSSCTYNPRGPIGR